jgi:hypothetical protein
MTLTPAPLPRMFFSTYQYAACKLVGGDKWPAVLAELMAHPERGPELLGTRGFSFMTLSEARHVSEVAIHVASNSYIARARCVAAASFLASGCDVWLQCDDDTFADEETIRRQVTACRATKGLVALPYANRDGHSMCMRHVVPPTTWLADGLPVRKVDRVGLGLTAVHRDVVAALDVACEPAMRFRDRIAPDALDCPGIFLSAPVDGDWVGEDYFFCGLVERAGFPMHVLLEASVQHESLVTKLDTEGHVYILGQDRAEAMAKAIVDMNEQARLAGVNLTPTP